MTIKDKDLNEILNSDEFNWDDDSFDDLDGFDIEDNLDDLKVESAEINKNDNIDENIVDLQIPDDITGNENIPNAEKEKLNQVNSDEAERLQNENLKLQNEVKEQESSIYNLQQKNNELQLQIEQNVSKNDSAQYESEIEELKDLVYDSYKIEKKYKKLKIGSIITGLVAIVLAILFVFNFATFNEAKTDALLSDISTQSIRENVTLSYFELVAESKMTYEEAFTFINSYPDGEKCTSTDELCVLYNEKLDAYDEFITLLTNNPTDMTSIVKNYKLKLLDINSQIEENIKNEYSTITEDNKLILE